MVVATTRSRCPRFDVTNAAALYRQGLTCQQIAERYGLTRGYVSARLRRAGTPMPAQRPRKQHHLDLGALLRLRQAGATWAELTSIFQVTRYAIKRCYTEAVATSRLAGHSG